MRLEDGAPRSWLARLPVAAHMVQRERLLRSLRRAPEQTALLFDIDGTLAPLVVDSTAARVPDSIRSELRRVQVTYSLVAFVTGRRALDGRRVAGLEDAEYIGNHGMETLAAGATTATCDPAVETWRPVVRSLLEQQRTALLAAGVDIRDKDVIIAMHPLGAPDPAAAVRAVEVAVAAGVSAGLSIQRGKGVVEIRPPVAINKGTAIERLLQQHPEIRRVLYAGDDLTDVDALRTITELRASGRLDTAVLIAVTGSDTPAAVTDSANLRVRGPGGMRRVLRRLEHVLT